MHSPPLLLLFWREQFADVLHRGDAGKAELSLFAGDILEHVFHFRSIWLVRTQLLTDLKARHRDIGPVPDGFLSIVEHQGPDLPLLLVTEPKLLDQALHVAELCRPPVHPVVRRPHPGS
jgi:hypothetical protein